MTRGRTLRTGGPGRAAAMKTWQLMTLHALAAATFIFLLQRYALGASLDSALLWALTFGGCAAGLAYSQSKR
ncbi:hypothetical protein JQ634_19940 [Bradyrhizobium sp. AUGA SZCCT0240]|uniref:hypothetical protein n=1 Tax=unclassified Bradyrhizobium TaxID=2631580 RepID=UPI001BA98879|nr:hypothetical protein [Bradyrhizobium sp. AUGA SZCCT0158]MBR1240979.1 hypothetical protein [Bradyrhizobium sp. AUGA SZCCT0274]MBR1255963.1 hypothetical protein [Bradyrhizobium sp. AUGA SZCCT0240]